MNHDHDLEKRIADLEWRLDRYHRHLEHALDHDRKFQLEATWGVVSSMCGAGAFFAALWIANKLDMDGWILGAIAGIGALIAYGIGVAWAERGRDGDRQKLSRLPVWDDEAPN